MIMSEPKLSDLSVNELSDVLSQLNFNKLKTILRENEISGGMLSELSSVEELQSIDVRIKPFEAKGWYKEILKLKERVPTFNRLSLECPVCFKLYSEVDPTALPCGHSLCIDDARAVQCCPICNKAIPKDFEYAVNYTIRSLILEEYRNRPQSNAAKENLVEERIVQEKVPEDTNMTRGATSDTNEKIAAEWTVPVQEEEEESKAQAEALAEEATIIPAQSATLEEKSKRGRRKRRNKKSKQKIDFDDENYDKPSDFASYFEDCVYREDDEAYESLQYASDNGNAYAMGFFAIYLSFRSWTGGMIDDLFRKSISELLLLNDDMHANFIIAKFMQLGRIYGPCDFVARYQRSVELGFTFANIELGLCYATGGARDLEKARECFDNAIKARHYVGYYYLGVWSQTSEQRVEFYTKAAQYGIVQACTELGNILESEAGIGYLRRAAKSREVKAMMLLSTRLDDSRESFNWLLEAAMNGDKEAAQRVMSYYADRKSGYEGIPETLVDRGSQFDILEQPYEAFVCFNLAAQMKHPAGYYYLGTSHLSGSAIDVDFGEAKRNFSLAVLGGHAEAMVALGKMYEKGQGVEKDVQRARQLYTQAYAKGYEKAKEDIDRLASLYYF